MVRWAVEGRVVGYEVGAVQGAGLSEGGGAGGRGSGKDLILTDKSAAVEGGVKKALKLFHGDQVVTVACGDARVFGYKTGPPGR